MMRQNETLEVKLLTYKHLTYNLYSGFDNKFSELKRKHRTTFINLQLKTKLQSTKLQLEKRL